MENEPVVNNVKEVKEKWYQKKGFTLYIIISVALSLILFVQNWNIQRDNDLMRRDNDLMRRDNAEVKHRDDVRVAYVQKGLIDGAKEREEAYYEIKTNYERLLIHCQKNPCNLPNDLSVIPSKREFESIESLLVRGEEKK